MNIDNVKGLKKIKGGVTAPKGFLAGGTHCGIKKTDQNDLALIYSEVPAAAAGVFTLNQVNAAPVKVSREHIKNLTAQAIVASSGCANACTGEKGVQDALQMTQTAAKVLGIESGDVLVASTGPIGTFLPIEKVQSGIGKCEKDLSTGGSEAAAEGILTTDLVTKSVAVSLKIGAKEVRIGAIAKGSGMIRPNMGTMFCFVTTDAQVDKRYLNHLLRQTADKTFNRIDVDGDTSTNDTVLCLANGFAGNAVLRGNDAHSRHFEKAFEAVCFEMSKAIVLDGEGATKFIEIEVTGAKNAADAKKVCLAVSNSKLVKSAFYGECAGWGRILAAIGYSGAAVNENKIDIIYDKKKIVKNGITNEVPRSELTPILKHKEIKITIDLNLGKGKEVMWTCDLSHKYIDINI